jgi:hypothetical protein
MTKITIDSKYFYDALEAYAKDSKKSWETIWGKQTQQLAKQIIAVTPPMMANRLGKDSFKTGKIRGERATATDILRLFSPYKKGFASRFEGKTVIRSATDMERIHNQNRNRRGRVTGKVRDIPAQVSILNAYIKKKQKMVGYFASGWNALRTVTNAKGIPAWITNKNAGGFANVKGDDKTLKFLAGNTARFADNLKGIERYMQIAADQQAINLWRQVKKYQEQLQARMTARTK